jgi:hypothetical protein
VTNQSEFVVYVDESGDHSLGKIDEAYPIFVLAFCVFYKANYIQNVVSAIEELKFDKFGHDIVILHERDIRKEAGLFKFRDRAEKDEFLGRLGTIIEDSNFILIACVIDKRMITKDEENDENPYHIALGLCLEALTSFVEEKEQKEHQTHVIFERRGRKEDAELELEFRRICDGANNRRKRLPFEIILADKKVNSAGLQLADLVARPVGLSHLKPQQPNRTLDVLRPKFLCRGGRKNVGKDYKGYGLRIFPAQKSEKPR